MAQAKVNVVKPLKRWASGTRRRALVEEVDHLLDHGSEVSTPIKRTPVAPATVKNDRPTVKNNGTPKGTSVKRLFKQVGQHNQD